jgi:hypothetical protein
MPGKPIVQFEKASSTREIQSLIGKKLRGLYDLAEPIPDRLAELLKQLAQQMDEPKSESR